MKRVLLGEVRFGVVPSSLQRALVQRDRFGLFAKLPVERLLHERHVDAKQLREDAVINHVADEPAELGVGADRSDELVKGNGIKRQVGAERIQL